MTDFKKILENEIKHREKLLRLAKSRDEKKYHMKKLDELHQELLERIEKVKKSKPKKNPKSAERKYKDFHHRVDVKKWSEVWNIPDKLVYIGKIPKIYYVSDKRIYGDNKVRQYVHDLKRYGDLWISPDGKTAIITNLNLNIKKEGLTG